MLDQIRSERAQGLEQGGGELRGELKQLDARRRRGL
jgi:hypothetical protein